VKTCSGVAAWHICANCPSESSRSGFASAGATAEPLCTEESVSGIANGRSSADSSSVPGSAWCWSEELPVTPQPPLCAACEEEEDARNPPANPLSFGSDPNCELAFGWSLDELTGNGGLELSTGKPKEKAGTRPENEEDENGGLVTSDGDSPPDDPVAPLGLLLRYE